MTFQITFDQIILGIGLLMFLGIIWHMSVRPLLSMMILAMAAVLGYCVLHFMIRH